MYFQFNDTVDSSILSPNGVHAFKVALHVPLAILSISVSVSEFQVSVTETLRQ